MRWRANPESLKPRHFEIRKDSAVGFYFYAYEGDKCIYDDLQDTFEITIECARRDFDVPKDSWGKVEDIGENDGVNNTIDLKRDRAIIGILGEICWGFKVNNFEGQIGVKYEVAEALLRRLLKKEKEGIVETYLNSAEVEIVKRGLVVVEKEIEEWEFGARMGATLEEVKNIPITRQRRAESEVNFEMAKNEETGSKELRDPDFCLGGFELWIYGRQFPESDDYWDGNWLIVVARCTANSSVVQAAGSILHLSELHRLMVECKQINNGLTGGANLECMEPNIGLKIKMKKAGHCELTVSITPDQCYQEHSFIFDLDQSYLPPLLESLELMLHSYPLKGLNHSPIHAFDGVNNNKGAIRKLFKTVPFGIKRGISWLLGKQFL